MSPEQRIARIFSERLNIEVPMPSTDIIADGLLDSLALVTLLFELEQQFEITIDTTTLDLEALRTVSRIAALVEGLGAGPA